MFEDLISHLIAGQTIRTFFLLRTTYESIDC